MTNIFEYSNIRIYSSHSAPNHFSIQPRPRMDITHRKGFSDRHLEILLGKRKVSQDLLVTFSQSERQEVHKED